MCIRDRLQCGQLSIDVHAASRNGVEGVIAERLVKRVAHVQAPNMAVARPSQIIGANGMRLGYPIGDDHAANGGRADQKSIRVKLDGRVVLIGKKGEFRRVTLGQEVLDVNISHLHLLVPGSERVEMAVGVLLQHEEVSEIVVDAIRAQVAEDPHSRLFIGKYEAAKIAGELLNSSPD